MTRIKKLFKNNFYNLESSLRSIIFLLLPVATFFSVLSDRNPYNYINIAVYAILSAAILFYVFKFKTFKFDAFTILIVLFNVFILLSQIVNQRITEYPRTILLLSVFSIIIYQFFVNIKNKESVYVAIIIGGLLFIAYFVYSYRADLLNLQFSDRLGEDFSDQNDLAKYLSLFGILSFLFTFKSKKWLRVFFIVSTVLFFFFILVTGSISNLLTFLLVIIVIAIFSFKRQNRIFAVASVLLTIALFVILLQFPFMSYFKNRIPMIIDSLINPTAGTGTKDNSAIDRFSLFLQGLRLFISKPLFGYGYDQVQYYTQGAGLFSHNNFVEVAASFGIFGFAVYEALLVFPVYKMFKERKLDNCVLYTTLFLFLFQIFLVIFRKKIEFVLMPLAFSITCFGYYPYLEIGYANKKIVFGVRKPFAKEEAEQKRSTQLKKVLCIFANNSDFDVKINYLREQLRDCLTLESLTVFTEQIDTGDNVSNNNIVVRNKYSDLRKLSFKIDKLKPDIICVDSKLLNAGYMNAFGLGKRIICFLRSDFDTKKIYLSKMVKYVAFDEDVKNRFDSINPKGKYDLALIDDALAISKKVPFTKREYSACFVGDNLHKYKYRNAIDVFKDCHKDDENTRFAIACSKKDKQSLLKVFEKEDINYIDLCDYYADIDKVLGNSKTLILVSPSKLDKNLIFCWGETDNLLIAKNKEETSKDDTEFEYINAKEIKDRILHVSKSKKGKCDNAYYLRYKYIKLFML